MSLNAVLKTAVTGLSVSQAALQVTATNVANVNTEGYGRKVVNQQTLVIGGTGAGVEVGEIRRIVDLFIDRELRVANADASRFQAITRAHDQIQSLLGDPADNLSLSGKLDAAFSALSTLAMEPNSVPRRTGAIAELAALAAEFSRLADAIQSLRGEAERQIGLDVTTANDTIERIFDLNLRISVEELSGGDSSGLQDQRAQALDRLSEIIDIRTTDLDNGAVTVSTLSGLALLDSMPRRLVYNPAGTVSADSAFSQITVNLFNPTTETIEPTGVALDSDVRSGSLRGWLDLRDQELPDLAVAIGELAGGLVDALNSIHNDNIAVPPPATLAGRNTGLVGGDLHGFTGQATFFSFDANNDIVNQVTVDFGAIRPTVADVIATVDAALGAGTLTLGNGVLAMTAAGGAVGVAIEQDAANPSSRGGRGFSHFFGLNDLLGAGTPAHFDTGFAAGESHNFTGTINLKFVGPSNQVPLDVTVDFGAIGGTFADIETELDTQFAGFADFSFGANGELIMTPTATFKDFRVHAVADSSDRAGTGISFARLFGVGDRFRMNQAKDMAVRADIQAAPALLALAKVDAAGSPALTVADGRGAQLFQDLALQDVSFAAAGDLMAVQTTLSNYAGQLLGHMGAKAAQAENLMVDREALRAELQNRRAEVQGVNLDEELAQMVIFQNAYNAAARVIQAAREMMEVLSQL